MDERYIIWYTPAAIKEHYDDYPNNVVHYMSEEDLRRVGDLAVMDDRTWETFSTVLDDAVQAITQSASRKDTIEGSIGARRQPPGAAKGEAMGLRKKTVLLCTRDFTPFSKGDLIEVDATEDAVNWYLAVPKHAFTEHHDPHEDEIVEIELDAHEPEYLIGTPALDSTIENYTTTPPGLWLGIAEAAGPGGGNPVVRLRGPRRVVREFVIDNWGYDTLEQDGMEVLN